MITIPSQENTALLNKLGLSNGQVKANYVYKNMWWSFDHARTAFGYGDLDQKDLDRLYVYLTEEYEKNHRSLVFTGWNEHHGTATQQTEVPIVRISYAAGITRPHSARLEIRAGIQS